MDQLLLPPVPVMPAVFTGTFQPEGDAALFECCGEFFGFRPKTFFIRSFAAADDKRTVIMDKIFRTNQPGNADRAGTQQEIVSVILIPASGKIAAGKSHCTAEKIRPS